MSETKRSFFSTRMSGVIPHLARSDHAVCLSRSMPFIFARHPIEIGTPLPFFFAPPIFFRHALQYQCHLHGRHAPTESQLEINLPPTIAQ
jgi:hypothetical protein